MNDPTCGAYIKELSEFLTEPGSWCVYCPTCMWHGEVNTAYSMISRDSLCSCYPHKSGEPRRYRVYNSDRKLEPVQAARSSDCCCELSEEGLAQLQDILTRPPRRIPKLAALFVRKVE